VNVPGTSKISELQSDGLVLLGIVFRNKDVRTLNVSMGNPAVVQKCQSEKKLSGEARNNIFGEAAKILQHRLERTSGDVLHEN